LGLIALMLVFAASGRKSVDITELLQSNAQTISALEQRLELYSRLSVESRG